MIKIKKLGDKIRLTRKEKRMSIEELAQKSDLSIGMISQVERNMVVPSINAVLNIAKGLDVTIGYFFEDEEQLLDIRKKIDREKLVTQEGARIYELLSPVRDRKMEHVLITLEGESDEKITPTRHEGEECGYIIEGRMYIHINGEDHLLSEGDSIYFDSTMPHYYKSYNGEKCISIWTMTPPSW